MSDGPSRRAIEASHRRLIAIALPMMASHVTTPLLGLVSATVIGRLGDAAALGAVALGALIFDFLFWTFGALRMGTAGLTAQAYGAGDDLEIDAALARALALALALGCALIVLQGPVAALAFALLGASEAVTETARTYVTVRIFAAPFTFANYAILGSVIGRARTDLGLLLQVAINCINIALAVLFVLGFSWGVAGVAAATVIAEMAGAALGFLLLARLGARPFRVPLARLRDMAALKRMLAVNGDIMIRTLALIFAFAVFTAQGAQAGDVTLAANAVLHNLFLMGGYALDGFGTAAEQMCGQALGARDESGFRRAVRLALGWSLGFGAAMSGLCLVFGGAFVDFVSTNEAVRAAAKAGLFLAALAPLAGAAAFAFDGVYIGATWTRAMRNLMLASLAVFLGMNWLFRPAGNDGLWLSFLAFLAARGIGQLLLCPRLTRASFAGLAQPDALAEPPRPGAVAPG